MPPRDPRLLAAIAAGGALGALARAGLAEAAGIPAGEWPWATFAVNVLGAFALGLVVVLLMRNELRSVRLAAFLGTGVCGALTTFSGLQLELLHMLDAGRVALALAYAAASIAAGLVAAAGGMALARRAA